MRTLLFAAALMLASRASAQAPVLLLTPSQAKSDVALMRRALETIHPGLYRYTSKSKVDSAFRRLEAVTDKPITNLALHREISLMLAVIHCDHTKAEMSDVLDKYRETHPTHLPFRFDLVEGRMIVVSVDGQPGAPPAGSEILEINGMPVPNVLLALSKAVAYDGTTDQAIAAKLSDDSDLMGDDLNEYFPSFYGFPESWNLKWKVVGQQSSQMTELKPIVFTAWRKLKGPAGAYRSEFYNGITWRMSGKAALLRIDTFVNYRNPVNPSALLGGFFRAMQEAGTEHLILDLRANGGGSEDASVAVGRYLIPRPFVWAKPSRYKTVRYGDLPQHIETWGDRNAMFNPPLASFSKANGWYERIPKMEGETLSDGDSAFVQQPVLEGAFRGRLTVLTGPRNASGATRTIAQLKEKAGATLVGEDSAGSAEGPTAGSIFLLKLPVSGLKVRIPERWNPTAIQAWVPGKGVAVDQLVVPTLADYQGARDRALEVARSPSTSVDVAEVIDKALAGRWKGTLDYRDYGNDRRVTLPTVLVSDGQELQWTYDDGPGKIVTSAARWAVDPSKGTVEISDGRGASAKWQVSEARLGADGAITVVLDGNATENDRQVIARNVLTRGKDWMRLTLLTRSSGEPFLMRHSYDLRLQADQ